MVCGHGPFFYSAVHFNSPCAFFFFIALVDVVKADHGFQSESRAFRNLLEVMSEFDKEERRQFLQFITGSPKLPIGGNALGRIADVICGDDGWCSELAFALLSILQQGSRISIQHSQWYVGHSRRH